MQYPSLDAFLLDLPALAMPYQQQLSVHDNLFKVVREDGRTFFIAVENGLVQVHDESDVIPSCIISMKEQTILDVIAGKLNPVKALMFGGIRVQGDVKPLLRLCSLIGG
ncbi:MAG: SCP2 sterol-binding domain-containing protein [Clostridia bacterium]|nr:SCP2 sterol-binding domain-containing protein [Clostridia bacterium]